MDLDMSQIDGTTLIGQVTMFAIALAMVASAVKPLFTNAAKSVKARNYQSLAIDLKQTQDELTYQRGLSRSMREWELIARETIREMQNDLLEAGVPENPRITRLLELLEENEKTRSAFIEEELNRES